MKKLCALLLLFSVFASSCAFGADIWATTDMTWAEYYAGETGETSSDLKAEGLDAFSTPTTHGLGRFPLVLGVSGDTGTTISGMKGVQVRISEDVFNALTDKTRFTVSTTAFTEYKTMNADGSFGAMVSEKVTAADAVMSMVTGSSARWGHYVLSVKSADIDIGTTDTSKVAANYMGALIETAGGKVSGLRHDNNIWSNTDIAFCVSANYTEPHGNGVQRSWQYTKDLEGETIKKVTYLLKDKPDVVIDNLNLYVKPLSSADIKAESEDYKSSASVSVKFVMNNAGGYTLSGLSTGSGRNSKPVTGYTYKDGVLTLTNPAEGSYTATFTSDDYADVSASFTVSYWYATTDMTWAEFYAGEVGSTSAALLSAGLDAVSSPTARVAGNFSQLVSESNDKGGRDITGVKAVQVRMNNDVYQALRTDSRYTFSSETFSEYKEVSADGSFGAMATEYETVDDAVITLTAPGTWGHYLLNIDSVDVNLGSGDTANYLGALVTTSDGRVYGMRHNNNLWFSAKDLALSIKEFVEVHGVSRSWKYTADVEGQTITKIQYMLKNLPDVVVNTSIYLKRQTSAAVEAVLEDGMNALMAGTSSVQLRFSGIPAGESYALSSVMSGSGRSRKNVEGVSLSGDTLTFSAPLEAGHYTATFTNSNYMDISAAFDVFTTDVTSLIVSPDNNIAGLYFLLTPRGAVDAVDEVLDANKFANASDYTDKLSNKTEAYGAGIQDSGFSFDVALNGVSEDYKGIVGFSKAFNMTSESLGADLYGKVYEVFNAVPKFYEEWRAPSSADFGKAGLRIVLVQADGASRDVTGLVGGGAIINSDGSIMLNYGAMAADCVRGDIREGRYQLSDEEDGETLIADGVKDGHIKLAVYIEEVPSQAEAEPTPQSPDIPDTPALTPQSPDIPDTPAPTPQSPDIPDTPEPEPAPDDTPSTPSSPALDLQSNTVKTKILSLFSGITGSSEILALPESASGTARSELSAEEFAAIPDNETPAVILPVMRVTSTAVYVWAVNLASLDIGDSINLRMFPESDAEVSASDDSDETGKFIDNEGNEVTRVPASKTANAVARMEVGKTYAPVITTSAQYAPVGSSGGGCESGFSATAIAVLAFFIRRNR